MNVADLLQLLTCPLCRDSDLVGLDERMPDGMLTCSRCGASYPVRGGIPILLPPDFDGSQIRDELEHVHEHKRQQADYFDREVAEEFEISRPHGAPPAYQWLMAEKFRHEPGGFLRFASRPVLRHVYRLMVGLANVAVGRWGNKLQVTAVRAN
jgi:uncharacterized protein YbaR (Trm112 family)